MTNQRRLLHQPWMFIISWVIVSRPLTCEMLISHIAFVTMLFITQPLMSQCSMVGFGSDENDM